MVLLHVGELAMTIEADDYGRAVVLAARDVMIFKASGIGFTADHAAAVIGYAKRMQSSPLRFAVATGDLRIADGDVSPIECVKFEATPIGFTAPTAKRII